MRFTEEGPSIHHLLFVDDNLFICKADINQCNELKKILDQYGEATCQRVNPQKSSIYFGVKVDEQTKASFQASMGIMS